MPRKLKVYQTSIGFFDLAVAAPSMKAALSLWGADSNLFHQGFAREAIDPETVAAAIHHPGVVLKRPVGTAAPFGVEATLRRTTMERSKAGTSKKKRKPAVVQSDSKAKEAALTYELNQRKREEAERRDRERRAREANRREAMIRKAANTLAEAEAAHLTKLEEISHAREALDREEAREDERWSREYGKLDAALRKARH